MKHNQPGGIAVLLVDAHFHACRRGAFPQLAEVLEPFARAPAESNARRGGMQEQ
jgi:hypothetical protein